MEIAILNSKNLNNTYILQIQDLFKQLSPNKEQQNINDIVKTNNTVLVACIENGIVLGIALMAKYMVISGQKAWIEDVVVDNKQRGKGIGRKLIECLLNEAKKQNLTEVLLFTENEKQAAIHLYEKLGFKQKESRLYTIKF